MPYYRKRYKPRRRRKRKTYRRTTRLQRLANDKGASKWSAGTVASAAFTALKIANGIKGLVNSEKKYKFGTLANGAMDDGGTMLLLSGVAQGDTVEQRDGSSVLMKSLQMRVKMTLHGSATSSLGRIIIFVDTQSDGETPTTSDLLQLSGVADNNVIALRNPSEIKRFVVLKDMRVKLDNDGNEIKVLDKFIGLNIHETYKGTGLTVADIQSNAVWMMYMSNEPTNEPIIDASWKILFTDN